MSTKTPGKTSSGRSASTGGKKKAAVSSGKKPAPKKKPAARKPAAKKATATRASSSKKGSSSKTQPGMLSRSVSSLRAHIGDRRADAAGLGLVLFGALLILALYFNSAGVAGDWLEAATRGMFGRLAYLLPPAGLWLGAKIVIAAPEDDLGPTVIGFVLSSAAVLGIWHLAFGAPAPGTAEGVKALWPAGGLAGWAISRPLQIGLATAGAVLVLLAVLTLGMLILTRTTFREAVDWITTRVRGEVENKVKVKVDAAKAKRDDGPTKAEQKAIAKAKRAKAKEDGEVVIDLTDDVPSGRAVADYSEAEQLPLPKVAPPAPAPSSDDAKADGLTAADREAGRIPAPIEAPKAEYTADGKRKARKVVPAADYGEYELPDLEILPEGLSAGRQSATHIEAQVDALQSTFNQFNINATVARWSRGPTVTTYEIELGPGVQVKKVANMGDDIAYALAAPDVRIVAPIPGKSAIGVEVPNRHRDRITLGDILRSPEAMRDDHPLTVALGVDNAGNPALVNLATMPHLLVSGATGSGKSVTLNAMITSIVMRARPDQVRLILVDPKRVELNHYDGAPHLLTPVVVDPKRAADAIQWAVKEMELRYDTLARLGYRNIDGYNDAVAADQLPIDDPEEKAAYGHMPYILLVIDELADLMLVAPRDVEEAICRIAQMARAVGIHMVIATQRPSVDVITGLIKANIPSRLALAVASLTDSRTILDQAGAEKLVGHGDMLFLPASQGKPSRLQGCFVSETEIRQIVEYCTQQREAQYIEGVVKSGAEADKVDSSRGSDDDSDEALLRRAAAQVVESGLGSTSMLQRKLRIGFARAGRLMDELEELGCVGPNEGSKARDVQWSPDMLNQAMESGLL